MTKFKVEMLWLKIQNHKCGVTLHKSHVLCGSLQHCWNIQSNQSLFPKLDQDLDQCQYFEVVCVKQPCMSSDV